MSNNLQKHRKSAVHAQRGLCIYCGRPMGADATAEHLQARQDGGTNCRQNIVAAHRACNQRRHADPDCGALRDPFDFATLVLIERKAGMWPKA